MPTPEVLSGYDKLGIVAILIFVLLVGLFGFLKLFNWLKSFGDKHLAGQVDVVQALTEVQGDQHSLATGITELKQGQSELHRRIDSIYGCSKADCPHRAGKPGRPGNSHDA